MSNNTSPMHEEAAPVHPEWTLGDRLRKARRLGGFKNQRSFAAALGISHGSIANYEDDRTQPNRLVLREWARITGVDEEWLQGEVRPGEAARPGRHQPHGGPSTRPLPIWEVACSGLSAGHLRLVKDAA